MNAFLEACQQAIGTDYVLTSEHDIKPYVTDWRQRSNGKALAVLRPANSTEVAALVKLCQHYGVPIVPQGGNTGLVLGSVPDASGKAIVLSLNRMRTIRAIDTANNTISVDAGCLLAQVQQAAAQAQRLYPLSLASEGSCTVGGNLSTNAGGTAVLRYGNARDVCLGVEVVTASGEIWNGMRGLRKDNTGYDLRDIFIGAEGTLGIITGAVLKLFPQPTSQVTALAALHSTEDATALLALAQRDCGATLTGFELISDFCMQLVERHFPDIPKPFSDQHPMYALLEIADHQSEQHANDMMTAMLSDALHQGVIRDVVISKSLTQSDSLWKLRESISEAQAKEGKNIKHDISLPISRIPEFLATASLLLAQFAPGCRIVCFGHLGDGNLHFNVSPPIGVNDNDFLLQQDAINRIVHDTVTAFNGSISAEHGLGALKRDDILRYKSTIEMQLMRSIKNALDPHNLMNPGKIL